MLPVGKWVDDGGDSCCAADRQRKCMDRQDDEYSGRIPRLASNKPARTRGQGTSGDQDEQLWSMQDRILPDHCGPTSTLHSIFSEKITYHVRAAQAGEDDHRHETLMLCG